MEMQGKTSPMQLSISLASAASLKTLQEHFLIEKQKADARLTRAKETIRLSFPRHSFTEFSSSDSDVQENSTTDVFSTLSHGRSKKHTKLTISECEPLGTNDDLKKEGAGIYSGSFSPKIKANHSKLTEASFKDGAAQSELTSLAEKEKIIEELFPFDYLLSDSTCSQTAKAAYRKEKDKRNQRSNSGLADSWEYSRVIRADESEDDVDLDSRISSKLNSGTKLGWIRSLNPFKRVSKAEAELVLDEIPNEVSKPVDTTEVIENLEAFSVPVKVNVKATSELTDLRCIRDIHVEKNTPIWCVAVCPNCNWLAVGTHSGLVALWKLPAVEENADKNADSTSNSKSSLTTTKVDVTKSEWLISDQPTIKLDGHTAAVIQLVWSQEKVASRLLSVSLDSTVRLWEPAVAVNAIAVLHCNGWPIAACFHPIYKDVMFTGCLTATLRKWKLQQHAETDNYAKRNTSKGSHASFNSFRKYDSHISEQTKVPDMVTAMSLSPNGAILAVGFKGGSVGFYDSRTLHLLSEVDCKNRRGRNSKGRKVTGLVWNGNGSEICITTNDSRIRVFNVNDLSCNAKFKGHLNDKTQLRAEFSADEQYVICGSENGWICVWDTVDPHVPSVNPKFNWTKKKCPTNTSYEAFRAFHDNLTSFTIGKPNLSALVLSRLILLDNNWSVSTTTSTSTTTATSRKGSVAPSVEQLRYAAVASKGTDKSFDNFRSNGTVKATARNLIDAENSKSAHVSPSAWFYDEKLCLVTKTIPHWRKDFTHGSCKDMVFIGGSASGTLRIFINIGFPMRR